VSSDGQGGVLVTGTFRGAVDLGQGTVSSQSYDIFVMKLGSTGQTSWVRTYGGLSDEWGNDIAGDGQGGALVTGFFALTANLGQGTAVSKGASDIFVMRLTH
jgi:hypothetical protein